MRSEERSWLMVSLKPPSRIETLSWEMEERQGQQERQAGRGRGGRQGIPDTEKTGTDKVGSRWRFCPQTVMGANMYPLTGTGFFR